MDIVGELIAEGFADLSTAGVTLRDTAGNSFAKVALPGTDLREDATVVAELTKLGNEPLAATRQTKIDSNGKKVTVAKKDLGNYPTDRVAVKWGAMVGVAVATEETEAPAPKKETKKQREAREAKEAAELAAQIEAQRASEAAALHVNGNGQQ